MQFSNTYLQGLPSTIIHSHLYIRPSNPCDLKNNVKSKLMRNRKVLVVFTFLFLESRDVVTTLVRKISSLKCKKTFTASSTVKIIRRKWCDQLPHLHELQKFFLKFIIQTKLLEVYKVFLTSLIVENQPQGKRLIKLSSFITWWP